MGYNNNTNRLPTVVTGRRENARDVGRIFPMLNDAASTNPELAIAQVTPRAKIASGTPHVERPGSAAFVHFLRVPRIDSVVWRNLFHRIRKHVLAFNLAHPIAEGSAFFRAYPRLRLLAGTEYQDNELMLIAALVHWVRTYTELVSKAVATLANHRTFAYVGDSLSYRRYSSALKFTAYNSDFKDLNGFAIPAGLLKTILESTQKLGGSDVLGAPVASNPFWIVDSRGLVGQYWDPWATNETDAERTNNLVDHLGKQEEWATLPYLTQTEFEADRAVEDDVPSLLGITAPGGVNDGLVPGVIKAQARYFRDRLVPPTIDLTASGRFIEMKNKNSTLYEFFVQELGLFTSFINIEAIDRSIKDNPIGNIRDFAEKNMVFRSKLQPSMNHVNQAQFIFREEDIDSYVDMYSTTDREYAQYMAQVFERPASDLDHSGPMLSGFKNYEPYYGALITALDVDVDDGETTAEVAIGEAFEHADNDVSPYLAVSDSIRALFGGAGFSHDNVAPYEFVGIDAGEVPDLLGEKAPSVFKPFVVPEEWQQGVKIIRSVLSPIIDVSDPTACGFYYLDPLDSNRDNEWSRSLDRFDSLVSDHTQFQVYGTDYRDRIVFVGDGVLLGPNLMQARFGVGNIALDLLPRAANGTDLKDSPVYRPLFSVVWNAKPFTIDTPADMVGDLLNRGEADVEPMLLAHTAATPEEIGQGAGVSIMVPNTAMAMFWSWWHKTPAESLTPQLQHMLKPFWYLPTVSVFNLPLHLANRYAALLEEFKDISITAILEAGSSDIQQEELERLITFQRRFFNGSAREGAPTRSSSSSFAKSTTGRRRKGGKKSGKTWSSSRRDIDNAPTVEPITDRPSPMTAQPPTGAYSNDKPVMADVEDKGVVGTGLGDDKRKKRNSKK